MENKILTVDQLVKANSRELRLTLVTGRGGLDRIIKGKDLNRPGLALAGFTADFPAERLQIIGKVETSYMNQLSTGKLKETLTRFFNLGFPCIIITGRSKVPPEMIRLAEERKIPIFTTNKSASDVSFFLTHFLTHQFSLSESIHGTLVDVYGTGLLFIGRASIGKSEIALDLVERGHRLVADDIVNLTLKPPDILLGSGPEMLKHMIEIRGVGVINVREVFGVRAIRLQKRIESVVELTDWDDKENYERLGLEEHYTKYLGVQIPQIKLPIYPGKNVTVIAEVIALNVQLKVYGYHAASDLNKRLLKSLRTKKRINNYLKWDNE